MKIIRCENLKCGREQSTLDDETMGAIGWAKTETGWLCPFCSDKGIGALRKIFERGAKP